MDYQKRLKEVQERVAGACARAGRSASEVTIVAVTKYVGVEEMTALAEAGQVDFGENRIQAAQPKWEHFQEQGNREMRWHFIGGLQTNKVKDVLGRFDLIHSLDRLSLAQAIHKRAETLGITVPCLVQVNVSGEESKGGFTPEEVPGFLAELRQTMPRIEVRGYMTMAPIVEHAEEARGVFRQLREWRDEWLRREIAPQTAVDLSMGMSGDFEIAVEEGATFVRIGSILVKP